MASIGRYENEPTAHYLKRLRDRGFLFHGSDSPDIQELEPRSTLDVNSAENTDTAIFATNNIAWATIFGVYGGYNGWSTDVINGEVTAKIPAKDRELVEAAMGTVYVLSPAVFKSSHGEQYKSYEPVKPLERVSVTVQDFYGLGGKVEFFTLPTRDRPSK